MESRDWRLDDKMGGSVHGFCRTGACRFHARDAEVLNRVQDDRGCAGCECSFLIGGDISPLRPSASSRDDNGLDSAPSQE